MVTLRDGNFPGENRSSVVLGIDKGYEECRARRKLS